MSAPDVRVTSRGRPIGGTDFSVVHKELSEDGRILLVIRDELGSTASVSIAPEVLEDVHRAEHASSHLGVDAENRVIDRLVR
ncbi:MAG: hypothetical protein L3K00_03060 [Thermoplasmata archaeon]|nr:hypothetical protein [Thermoplasmata archaeon]